VAQESEAAGMTAKTVQILALAVILLFAAVFALNWQRDKEQTEDEQLFPGLKERIDDTAAITVTDADGTVTVKRDGERWIVAEKAGYAANTDTLRRVLLAIADARKVEQKTSNPELYDRLGVGDPSREDGGVLLSSAGLGDQDFALILGDAVQQEYRYVRIADQAQSWLIDQNPDVPDDASGWLAQEIVDIDSLRIKSVTVTHEDGETIHIHKDKEDATNFAVDGIPEGRELSYPSVANGMAAVLSNLTLEDVVADPGSADESAATTVISTFDGLELRIVSSQEDDQTWITLTASATEPAVDTDTAATPAQAESSSGESAEPPAGDDTAAAEDAAESAEPETQPADEAPDPQAEAAAINTRVSGWRYRIADYKANQLTRRWDDLLQAADE
jgi:hypothetical protein